MVLKTILFVLGCLMFAVHLTEAGSWLASCTKKVRACSSGRTETQVCGFIPGGRKEYRVFDSECTLYTHACKNRKSIAIVDMTLCDDYRKKTTEGQKESLGRGGTDSPPESAFVRPANIVVPEGADVTIVCYVIGGNPQPEFSWKLIPVINKDADAGEIPDEITSKVTTSSLTLEKITREKAGTYTCTAYNILGSVSASTTVDVQYKPTATVTPQFRSINIGQTATFKCTADGNPKPKIVWKKGSVTKTTQSLLMVRNAKLTDHGDYRCVASNSISTYSAEARLNVKVDGGWSRDISCTQCGNNPYNNNRCQKKCERKCNNPTPLNGGTECSGDRYIARDCPNDQCEVPNHKKECFPGDAVVPLDNGGAVYMRDLKVGDNVLAVTSDNRLVKSKVLTFLHREENSETEYKNIKTDKNTVSLTPDHLIFVSEDGKTDNLQALFASKVKTGMYVNEAKSGQIQLSRVNSISNSTRTGLYAPLTEHGNIVVDHVMSSCYAVINSHWLAHVGLSPLRWYYIYGGLVQSDTPKEGIHWYPTLIKPLLSVLPQS